MTPILEDTEYLRYANDDEAKSESDVHEVASGAVELDVFYSDNFMEGLRKEKLFGPTDADDVNIMQTSDTSDSGSDADDEDVMPDNESWPQVVQGVEDVADAGSNEDNSASENLGMTDEELCDIAESGWYICDEDHSRVQLCLNCRIANSV
ncbi:hypothetical protein PI126_g20875 [Phytophthora idaei]|nr:hypothetical protein PI126_g20875 [Phytophthora idaei]